MTQVSDVMTRGVRTLTPQDSIVRAAQAMDELDVGAIPVCEGDTLVGLVTDRDIVVRGLAKGGAVETTRLEDVMSHDPRWCFEDQPLDEVLEQMREVRIRRVAVFDHERHLVGILSLGDVAVKADGDGAGAVLREISEPAVPDRPGGSVSQRGGPLVVRTGVRDTPPPGGDPSLVQDANPGREHQGEGILNRHGRFGNSTSPEELGPLPD